MLLRLGRLAARVAAPRMVSAKYGSAHLLCAVVLSLALASIATLTLGFVQRAVTLALASVVCSTHAALTLGSLVLVNRRAHA